jgi:hypothetical protein
MASKIHLLPPHPQHFPLLDQNSARRSLLYSSSPCLLLLLVTQKKQCRYLRTERCGKLAMIISRERGNSLVNAQASDFNPYLYFDSEVVPYVASFYGTSSPPSRIPRIWNRVDGTGMAFHWYVHSLSFENRQLIQGCVLGTGIRMV